VAEANKTLGQFRRLVNKRLGRLVKQVGDNQNAFSFTDGFNPFNL
jgi:hypothetical protein